MWNSEDNNAGTLKPLTDCIGILLLIVLVFIFFSRIILSGDTLFGSDFVLQFHPWKKFIYDSIRSDGSIPFWNRYLFSGSPFIANIQASMFYPLGFLYYLLPAAQAYTYSTILHCVLGSVFMYAFMRSLRVLPLGSLLSSFVFMFNGYFAGHLYAGHLSFVQNYIWIPLVFLFLCRFVRTFHFRYSLITGLIVGVQILGGFPQIAFYTILGILGFGLFYLVGCLNRREYRSAVFLVLGLILMIITGFALASVQVLPTLEFTRLSTRAGGINYSFATYDSLHPKELLSFFIPDIFGNVIDSTYWRSLQGAHFWETCGYLGILPIFLVFFSKKSGKFRNFNLFFVLLAIIALFLAFGKYNPLYPFVYKLPGFNSFRIPAQIIFLYVFGMAVMSGIGVDRWRGENGSVPKKLMIPLLVTGIVILFFFIGIHFFHKQLFAFLFNNFTEALSTGNISIDDIFGRTGAGINKAGLVLFISILLLLLGRSSRSWRWLGGLLVLFIIIADLGSFSRQFITPYDFTTPTMKRQIVRGLNSSPARGRTAFMSPFFKTNDGLEYRFSSVLGYDPLIGKRYSRYIQASQGMKYDNHVVNLSRIHDPTSKLLRMLNIRQFIYQDMITEIDNKIPYANLVTDVAVVPSHAVLNFLKSDQFDPRRTVVFESESAPAGMSYIKGGPPRGSSKILEYRNEEILIRVVTDRPCYLVLSELFYPGWHAEVDGFKAPILRGNYLFRVIPVNKGQHNVRIYFKSRPFRIGAVISLLTVFVSLVFIFSFRPRSRT